MSYWIHIAVLFQYLTNAETVIYVREERISSGEAASLCNLATPDILFGRYGNTVSFDGTNLNIADGESMWSGYVQTYAAFHYEGCCEEEFANSVVYYTNMNDDPGECYSICKTYIIGIQTTTCYCNPRPKEEQTHATGCDITCSNPTGTLCGGKKVVSLYRKVKTGFAITDVLEKSADDNVYLRILYPGFGASLETENCKAFYWENDDRHFYTWAHCWANYNCLCENDVTSSTEFKYTWYRDTVRTWRAAATWCLQENKKPAFESGYPDFNLSGRKTVWIGQIRSRVIGSDEDFNNQTPGWRRGVITNAGGKYLLQFNTHPTTLTSLCVNVSTSPPPSDSTLKTTQRTDRSSTTTTTTPTKDRHDSEPKSNTDDVSQFPMIVVYVAVPLVLVIVAVIVIVILCKRRQASKERMISPGIRQEACVTNPSYTSNAIRKPEGAVVATRGDEYAVVTKKTKPKQPVTIDDNEYDTTVTFSSLKHTETDNTYNRLDDVTGNTNGHNSENGGNEVDLYDHAVSKDNPLKTSKGRNTFQNDTTVTFSSLKHTDNTYNRLDDVTGNADTHETDGDNTDLYDHAVSTDKPTKASKGNNKDHGGVYDTALAVNKQGETQTSALQDIYAQPIPRSQRK